MRIIDTTLSKSHSTGTPNTSEQQQACKCHYCWWRPSMTPTDHQQQFSPPISQESNHHHSREKKKKRAAWVILKARTQSSWVFTHNKWNDIRIYGKEKKNSSRLLQLFRDEGLHISGYYHLYIASERAVMNAVHVHSTAYLPAVPLKRSKGFQPTTLWM